jgi:transcription antitermination factor NusG
LEQDLTNKPIVTSSGDKAEWFVFYVKSRTEFKAEQLLKRDGFESYLPVIKVLKQWSDRKKWIEEPLFKSYIFVKVKRYQLYNVLQTPPIVTYVRFAGEPAIIHQAHIDLIKELIINKTKFELSTEVIKVGESIKIKTGPFSGQNGVVKEIRGKKRLLVSLESINFTLEIEL